MSIHEIDRTPTLDPAQDGVVVHKDAEVEEPGIGGDGGHGQSTAAREVGSGKEEKNGKLNKEEKEDQAHAAPQPPSANAANAKTIFGMKRSNPTVAVMMQGNETYDYEQKYPEDAPFEEAAPAARVWKTYEDESRKRDVNMVEESRDSVDVLLVFSLQPNYAAMSASLLYESVLVQRAIANGSSVDSIAPSPLNPTIAFVPATTDVWVNGLWFTSLFLSLTTALVAVLVKQWLHHYVDLPSGTPRERSFTRQFRYAGFEKWHVQVIIGLLPVLMHLALAIFLGGLVIFLQPLRVALSWIICAGTVLVYIAYVVATILAILFPQCPYRTPLCDLVYVSLCRTVPRVTWYNKEYFLSSLRDRDLNAMFLHLPRVQARTRQSLTMIESKFVQRLSTNLAAEALHWLSSVSSNPTVQNIVIQSIGGLPMASEEKFFELREDSKEIMWKLRESLLERCLLETEHSNHSYHEPVPGMELKLGRLLRFPDLRPSIFPRAYLGNFFGDTSGIYSFELTAAILSNRCTLHDRETLNQSVSPGVFLKHSTRSSKLSPRSWYQLMVVARWYDVFSCRDPDHDNNANIFPLLLCSAIVKSFTKSLGGRAQGFDSPSVLTFEEALPYFIEKIYDDVLFMFSKFNNHSSSEDPPSSLKSLRVLVVATKFLLHRLSLPHYGMSRTTILESLMVMNECISKATFSSQEATTVIPVLEDIIACGAIPDDSSRGSMNLWNHTTIAYHSLTTVAPSACSLRGLRSTVDHINRNWNPKIAWSHTSAQYACDLLTDLLVKHTLVAFTVFREKQCL
ncbi:hypothetical protein IW261DRAFT_1369119, partial [Armillaria novae-zelandiae]